MKPRPGQVCIWCKRKIEGFSDWQSEIEYDLNGMCQVCQDKCIVEKDG